MSKGEKGRCGHGTVRQRRARGGIGERGSVDSIFSKPLFPFLFQRRRFMQESVDGDEHVVGFAKLQDGKLGLEQVGRT